MTAEEIVEFNKTIAEKQGLITVSDHLESIPSITLHQKIAEIYDYIYSQKHYYANGDLITKSDLEAIRERINFEGMNTPLRHVSFGIITERLNLRVLPTDEMFLKEGDEGFFDRLQMSSLEIGTPVAILWRTYDRKWLFVQSNGTTGWIKPTQLAYCSRYELKKWEFLTDFAVITNYRTSIYADAEFTKYISRASVGNRFPIDRTIESPVGVTAIRFPVRDDDGTLTTVRGYINSNEVNIGYLPYTSRNLLTLAFSMLNAPYGWGGMFGEQDCSGLVGSIFSAVGITMPRNSAMQARVGTDITDITQAIPGATTLQMPGHIMLYVGMNDNSPYTIHATWNFRENTEDNYILRMPARVILSKLTSDNGTIYYSDRAIKDISVVR